MTTEQLQAELDRLDNGLLLKGSHNPDSREFCALEFESQVRGREWSDKPITLPDLRPLNDARWSTDLARTQALLPAMSTLWDWSTWSKARKQEWASQVTIETVRQIVSELPGLSADLKSRCQTVVTVEDAANAAYAAAYAAASAATSAAAFAAYATANAAANAAAYAAASAAAFAAYAAAYAAASAANAAADRVLNLACSIFINAAVQTEKL